MGSSLEWWGDLATAVLKSKLDAGTLAAADRLAQIMRENIGEQGPPRSLPDNFPHMDSQALRDSVGVLAGDEGYVVGSDLDHAVYLEFGTATMAPRPWALRSAMENEGELARVAAEAAESGTRPEPLVGTDDITAALGRLRGLGG